MISVFENSKAERKVIKPNIVGLFGNVRFVLLLLITLAFLLPAIAQADGLFDFQMKLAKKGNAEAEYKVGEMYETGFGVKEDMTEAMSWITKAANKGHETAGFKLLYWDIEKNGVTASNKEKLEALKVKAKEGNPQAQFYVGKMQANGVGLKKNYDKAINWLNKAALVGVLAAERELAIVRESKQRAALALAKRRADEKRRAQLKVKQEQEKQAKLEQKKKLQAQKQAEVKARALEEAKQDKAVNSAAATKLKEEKAAAVEEAKQASILAQKKADAKKREAQKKALIKQRTEEKTKRKAQFESDPCSGKSARFLSTCR